ncbi:hypothetical protein L3Y34_016482 [Caenorhabditis briggsae]|uniref:SCP domain-containing protein n=1 Tax=Caenorhabditis briggsae TaxID=6238 RepID=A0AAE9DZG4_CAEBR|nr:hypothetical protein L3Y34_016482 [Caenorhabditis briggsae]
MRKLKWDDSLATSAQDYANTCPESLSKPSGENIYFGYYSTDKITVDYFGPISTQVWKVEFIKFGWNSTKMDDNASNIKEATQMVWASTGSIGCGVKVCPKDPCHNNMFKYVVVCHYEKPGNVKGYEIYKEGKTCSTCLTGLTCETATGLCA